MQILDAGDFGAGWVVGDPPVAGYSCVAADGLFVGEQIGAGYIANGQNFGADLVVGDQCCVAAGGLVVGVQIAAGCVAGQVAAGYLATLK